MEEKRPVETRIKANPRPTAPKTGSMGTTLKAAINAIQKAELKGITVEKIPHPSPANPLANKENGNVWKKIAAEVITAE